MAAGVAAESIRIECTAQLSVGFSESWSRRRVLSFADACDRFARKPSVPSASCSTRKRTKRDPSAQSGGVMGCI